MAHNFSAELLRQCCDVGKEEGKAERLDREERKSRKVGCVFPKNLPATLDSLRDLGHSGLPNRIFFLLPRVQMLTSVFDRTQPMRIRMCMSHRVA